MLPSETAPESPDYRAGRSRHLKCSAFRLWPLLAIPLSMLATAAAAQEVIYETDRVRVEAGLDAASVVFFQHDSWFGEAQANIGVESGTWNEFAIEPQLYLTIKDVLGGELTAGISAVASQTFGESAEGFAAGIDDPGAATLEKLYVGWKANFGADDFVEIMGGDFDYQIGTGFLIKDGGRDGGNRGGFYLGARSASRGSALARLQKGNLLLEGFWLGNNPGRGGIKAHVRGINAEYTFSERASIGATYIEVAHFDDLVSWSVAEQLKTYDVRGAVSVTDRLTFSGEYARQTGAEHYEGDGWYAQATYKFADLPLEPTLSYRYAVVTGDDPSTSQNEAFVPLAYGFTDYAQWYQGELTGNWIFGNSNQKTHLVKGTASLSQAVSITSIWLDVALDDPRQLGVEDDDFGNEFNVILDWEASEQLFLSAAVAVLVPGAAAREFTGGNNTWAHLMLYASFSF
jgi:hypothetical protein